MNQDFGFVDERVAGLRWDAKYASSDNFVGGPVDGYRSDRIVGSTALCVALERARDRAASVGFGLLIWDGYRPQRAVEHFLRWSREPDDAETKRVHHPRLDRLALIDLGYVAERSGHTRGAAVDLTLVRLGTDEPVDMGGRHDLMDVSSHHGTHGLSAAAARHRHYLRSIMWASGFEPYEREWWHYTLREEPFPHTYFDFEIR